MLLLEQELIGKQESASRQRRRADDEIDVAAEGKPNFANSPPTRPFVPPHTRTKTLATEPLRNSSITIKQVTAKRSRLVIDGEMAYDNAKVPFTYRTSIGVRGKVRCAAGVVVARAWRLVAYPSRRP